MIFPLGNNLHGKHLKSVFKMSYMFYIYSDSSQIPMYSVSSHPKSTCSAIYSYIRGNAFIRNFSLRVHKFQFKWDLVFHISVCLASMLPFAFSGNRLFAIIPLSIWLFYNILFVIGTSRANSLVPGFGKFKHSFTASIEEFFSTKYVCMFIIIIAIIVAVVENILYKLFIATDFFF